MEKILEMDIEQKMREVIRDYIANSASMNKNAIEDNLLIFEQGLLDSMGFLFLIDFIKEKLNVEVNDKELIVENFDSVNSIVAFVYKKLQNRNHTAP